MIFTVILMLGMLNVASTLNPGDHVLNFTKDVSSASTADEYSCFVDAPHDHATTGCRKSQSNCSTSQAVCSFSEWDGVNYKWSWECSRETFLACGLQWCGSGAECVSINNCQCEDGLKGNPILRCYNLNETETECVDGVRVITVTERDHGYFLGFWIASSALILMIIVGVVISFLNIRRTTGKIEIEEVEMGNSIANETYGFFDTFGRQVAEELEGSSEDSFPPPPSPHAYDTLDRSRQDDSYMEIK